MSNSPELRKRTHHRDPLKASATTALLSRVSQQEDTGTGEQGTTAEVSDSRSPSLKYHPSKMATDEAVFPKGDDEAVNSFIIIEFLDQASRLLNCYLATRAIDKIRFEITSTSKKHYMAHTDGALQPRVDDKVQAVVETKRDIRTGVEPEVTRSSLKSLG